MWLGLGILLFSMALEGWATWGNVKEMNKRRGKLPLIEYLKRTKDSDLIILFGENSAAVLGLTVAILSLLLAWWTGNGIFDSIGSIVIGVVLIGVAIFLGREVKSLLIGEAADPNFAEAVKATVPEHPNVEAVLRLITVQQGPGEVLVAMKIRMKGGLNTAEVVDRSIVSNRPFTTVHLKFAGASSSLITRRNQVAKPAAIGDHASMRSALTHGLIALLIVTLTRPSFAVAAPAQVFTDTVLAAGGPKIAVVVVSLDAKSSAQQGALEGAGEEAIERSARFSLLLNHEAFNPNATKKRDKSVEESREKLKAGKQALDELDNVKATESFAAAVELLQNGDLSRDFPALLDALTMKAAGHATGGENAPAKKDIEAVIGLNTKAEFSPTFFPPDLLKFTEVMRKQASNARGELLVRTEPPGARVWVDGTFRGISPVSIAGLTTAKHFVTATLGGFALVRRRRRQVKKSSRSPQPSSRRVGRRPSPTSRKTPKARRVIRRRRRSGQSAQLDQVLLVIAKKSTAGEKLELIGVRLETRDQHNAAYKTDIVSATDLKRSRASSMR